MALPEASEAVPFWQQIATGGVIGFGAILAMVWRFVSERNKATPEPAKHAVLEAASIADTGPIVEIGKTLSDDLRAIRELIEDQVKLSEEEKRREERDKIRERLDEADEDRREMKKMMQDLLRQGAKHQPGRPLQDE